MFWRRHSGILFMCGAAVSFAGMSALMKVSCESIPKLQIVSVRALLALLVLSLAEKLRHGRLIRGVNRKRLFLRALFGFIGLVTYLWAIANVDLGIASALNQSSPIFVAVFSALLLRETPPRLVPPLVLVAFFGVWLIVSPDLGDIDWHALIGVVSGITAALAYVMIRDLRKTDGPSTIIRWFAGWSIVFSLPFLVTGHWVWASPMEWAAMLGIGATGLLGQLGMTEAFRRERAAVVSPFIYLTVLVNHILGWLFWNEWPQPTAFVGALLIVTASLGIGWSAARTRDGISSAAQPASR